MVVPLGFVHPGAGDRENGDAPPVRAAHLDRVQLTAADQREPAQEEVVRRDHERRSHCASQASGS